MLILAIDPGGRTGIATYDTEAKEFDGWQLNDTDGHHDELWSVLGGYYAIYCNKDPENMIVIVESFEFRNSTFEGSEENESRKGLELVSREYIGVCKLFRDLYKVKLIEQQPSVMKFVSNQRLEALGLLHKPATNVLNKDYNAAMKHLLRFIVVRLHIRAGITDKWRKQ